MNAISDATQLVPALSGIDIPPCPAILLELQSALNRESCDQRDIACLISQDVALSGHVMRIVNSPAFSNGQEIGSVMQAINRLGSQQVFNLAVGQLLKLALDDTSAPRMERFWESSAQTARLSAEMARRMRRVRPDIAYTFGLFHDCGIPLLIKRFGNTRDALAVANHADDQLFTDVEESMLGTNHAIVGYYLARRWRMPDFMAEAVLYHHEYSVLQGDGDLSETARSLIAICVLAEHITRLHNHGDGEHEWEKAAPAVCGYFNLSLGAVDDLIEDLRDWLG